MISLAKTAPIVSCIIPVKDSEATIVRAVASALKSGLESLEVIVVDDKSSDNSVTNVENNFHKEARVRLLGTEGQGPGAARNLGIEYSRGKYITFLDSDDELGKNALRKATLAAERAHLDLVSYELPARYFDFSYETIPTLPTKGQFFRRSLVAENTLRQSDAPSGQDGLFGHLLLSVAGSVGHHRGAKYIVRKDRGFSQYEKYWRNTVEIASLIDAHMEHLLSEYDRLGLWDSNTYRLANFLLFETLTNRLIPLGDYFASNTKQASLVYASINPVLEKLRTFADSSLLAHLDKTLFPLMDLFEHGSEKLRYLETSDLESMYVRVGPCI